MASAAFPLAMHTLVQGVACMTPLVETQMNGERLSRLISLLIESGPPALRTDRESLVEHVQEKRLMAHTKASLQ